MNQNSKFSVRDICYAGLFAAVIAVMAQISIPMPLGVPMTMQTFAITLAAVVLGSKLSAIATLVYLLLGAVGVPVLANFSGGIDKFVGPTGGFLISFPIMAYIIGLGVEHRDAFKGAFPVAVVVGTVVNYIVGVILFVIVANSTVSVAVSRLRSSLHSHRHHQGCAGLRAGPNIRKLIPGVKKHEHRTASASPARTSGLLRPWLQRSLCGAIIISFTSCGRCPGRRSAHLLHRHLCSCCPNKLGTDLCDTQGKGQAVRPQDRGDISGWRKRKYHYQTLIREIDAKATPRCWPISAGTAAGSPSAPAATISAKANT